jgi:hypothetical protein
MIISKFVNIRIKFCQNFIFDGDKPVKKNNLFLYIGNLREPIKYFKNISRLLWGFNNLQLQIRNNEYEQISSLFLKDCH